MAAYPQHFQTNMNLESKKRLHPCFLTIAEAKEHPELVYSDHLPILTEIPVPGAEPVKAISLNVLGPVSFSGLHDATTNREWETSEQTTARYQRIAQGLKQAIESHDASLLLLQETTMAENLPQILQEHLGEEWRILIDEHGLLSCYNIKRFAMPLDSPPTSTIYQYHRTHSLNFTELSTGQPLVIHNVWGNYKDFADEHEQYYRDLLALKPDEDPATIKAVIGDSNSRSTPSPTDLKPRNIITDVIPTGLNQLRDKPTHEQFGDHPECAFVSIKGKIQQLCFKTLHFATGKIVIDSRALKEIPHEPDLYRPILFLDADRISQTTIAGVVLHGYQNYLKENLRDDQILIGMSANTLNDQRIFFRFSPNSAVYGTLADIFKNQKGISTRIIRSDQKFPCLFVAIDQVELVHKAIHSIQFPRQYWIEQMELQLNKPTNTFFQGWFMLIGSQSEQDLNRAKKERLEELRTAFEKAPLAANNEELLAIKNDWAEKIENYTIDGEIVTLSNLQLMGHKRGPQKDDGKLTASAILLTDMDRMLNPSSALGNRK